MSQLSKTTGKLWAAMAGEVSEDVILSEFASYSGLVLAQANYLIFEQKRFVDKKSELESDIKKLEKYALEGINLSRQRDVTMTSLKYARIMSDVLKLVQDILTIAVKWDLIEFEDSTRFGSYKGEK